MDGRDSNVIGRGHLVSKNERGEFAHVFFCGGVPQVSAPTSVSPGYWSQHFYPILRLFYVQYSVLIHF